MRYGGLTEDEALKTITINGAIQLGIENRVGSLEVGKDADVAIWTGDPLSVYSRVEKTYVDGEKLFDRQEDLASREAGGAKAPTREEAPENRLPTPAARPRHASCHRPREGAADATDLLRAAALAAAVTFPPAAARRAARLVQSAARARRAPSRSAAATSSR